MHRKASSFEEYMTQFIEGREFKLELPGINLEYDTSVHIDPLQILKDLEELMLARA